MARLLLRDSIDIALLKNTSDYGAKESFGIFKVLRQSGSVGMRIANVKLRQIWFPAYGQNLGEYAAMHVASGVFAKR